MSLISIIVPVYNAEKYLERCVESILVQSIKEFEIILVNDGSKDFSLNVCNTIAYKDNRIHVLNKENGGVASARNMGIAHSNGDFLMFVDADDELSSPLALKKLIDYSNFDYVVGGFQHCHEIKNQFKYSEAFLDEKAGKGVTNLPDKFFINGFIHSCCGKLYRTEIIKNNCIKFPDYRISEDSFFNLRYMKCITSWKLISTVVYSYFHRNIGTNVTAKFNKNDIDTYVELYKELISVGISKAVVKETMYPQFLSCLSKCYKSGETWGNKVSLIKTILKRKYVVQTIIFTKRNRGEWITGIVYCLCNEQLYQWWFKFVGRGK